MATDYLDHKEYKINTKRIFFIAVIIGIVLIIYYLSHQNQTQAFLPYKQMFTPTIVEDKPLAPFYGLHHGDTYLSHQNQTQTFLPHKQMFTPTIVEDKPLTPFYGLHHGDTYLSHQNQTQTFLPHKQVFTPTIVEDKPSTPFYGLHHRDTYGLPLSHFSVAPFQFYKEDWKLFFPHTISATERLGVKNPTGNVDLFTRGYNVTSKKINYKVGDEFFAKITSVDEKGRAKTFGGDYYRARLVRGDKTNPDGIPCRVIDIGDGTYTVKAPLVLEGTLTLDVKLVYTIEAINEVISRTEKLTTWGQSFQATLHSGEIVTCNVNLTTPTGSNVQSLCDYSNPRNQEPWFCEKPPSRNCSKIADIKYGRVPGSPTITPVNFGKICSKFGCFKTAPSNVAITVQPFSGPITNRPSCQNEFLQPSGVSRVAGYFKDHHWNSLTCTSSLNSLNKLQSCLNNKVIYFLGDSTIRNFFYLIVGNLKLVVAGPDNTVIWQQPRVAHYRPLQRHNTTLYYRAHGPPLLNPGPPNSRPYISDSISDLPVGGSDVYVIFNIGAHLYLYHPSIYIHRLNGIKKAIQKHHEKYPETKFIVRGLNVVEWVFEWNIYRFEIILRNTFFNMDNVLFLNFWDITTMWPLDDYHPKQKTLDQQALNMLGYICS